MNQELSKQIITLLFISGDPIGIKNIATVLEKTENEIKSALYDVEKALQITGLGYIIQNDNIVLTTTNQYSDIAQKLKEFELSNELTPAQLQVLTIISYMGPVNNSNISFIRGVQSSQTIRSLTTRGLITKNDKEYIISIDSMKYLGVNKIEDLPNYAETREKLEQKINEALNG